MQHQSKNVASIHAAPGYEQRPATVPALDIRGAPSTSSAMAFAVERAEWLVAGMARFADWSGWRMNLPSWCSALPGAC